MIFTQNGNYFFVVAKPVFCHGKGFMEKDNQYGKFHPTINIALLDNYTCRDGNNYPLQWE